MATSANDNAPLKQPTHPVSDIADEEEDPSAGGEIDGLPRVHVHVPLDESDPEEDAEADGELDDWENAGSLYEDVLQEMGDEQLFDDGKLICM